MTRHRFISAAVVAATAATTVFTVTAGGAATAAPDHAGRPAVTTPTVVSIKATKSGHHDRLVLRFHGGLPDQRSVQYVKHVVADPSGKRIHLKGRHFAVLRLESATAQTGSGPTAPRRITPLLPNLRQVKLAGDFEGVLTYGLGLRRKVHLHLVTRTSPNRVVVRIPHHRH